MGSSVNERQDNCLKRSRFDDSDRNNYNGNNNQSNNLMQFAHPPLPQLMDNNKYYGPQPLIPRASSSYNNGNYRQQDWDN